MKLATIDHEIVNAIYNIPLGNSNWKELITVLKRECNSLIGFMMVVRPNQSPVMISAISENNKQWLTYIEDCYKSYPWKKLYAKNEIPNGVFDAGHVQIDTNYWEPNDHFHTAGGLLFTCNKTFIVLGFPRNKEEGIYNAIETQHIAFYGKQIIKAIELEGVLGKSLPQKVYEDALVTSYGLTTAESKLVLELFRCGSLPKTSKSLNRSYHTVRNQIKSVFKKTKTSNQVELYKLLATNYYK